MLEIAVILAIILIFILIRYIKLKKEYAKIENPTEKIKQLEVELAEKTAKNKELNQTNQELQKDIESNRKKIQQIKSLHEAVQYSINNASSLKADQVSLYDELCPSVTLLLHAMNSKELQKEFNANQKLIEDFVKESVVRFEERFSNKAISAVYSLAVIAMQAEVQNILHTIKYEELDKAVASVKEITQKYYSLAAEATHTITGALTGIISKVGKGQSVDEALRENISRLEYLFINAVKIEYNYYVKREQAKAEQAALREQMRIEAAEKKTLEAEKKKIEKEENKFNTQIAEIQSKLEQSAEPAESPEMEALRQRLLELEAQLSNVAQKKEEIVNLQNGKAGNVYIISNLGSFGENVFKIGMTRRQDPQDRIDELGDASVPFEFDVHSFIFSDDAVALESELHKRLNDRRVNKVNMRKEFFRATIDELEALTHEISPTAEFNRTMAAEEYRQSLSTDKNYEVLS